MVQNDISAAVEDGDGVVFLTAHVAQPAADESHDHVVRGDLEGIVPQTDTVARRGLSGNRDEWLGHTEWAFQIDRAGDEEDNGAIALADCIAQRTRPGILQVGNFIDHSAAAAGS
jgi:hypothetical protein